MEKRSLSLWDKQKRNKCLFNISLKSLISYQSSLQMTCLLVGQSAHNLRGKYYDSAVFPECEIDRRNNGEDYR